MIRSELDVLLDKVQDEALRAELRTQIDRLKQRRSFGLVFERHIPERVRLPQHPVRVGSHVVSRDDDSPTYEVLAIDGGSATIPRVRDPDGAYLPAPEHRGESELAPLGFARRHLRLRPASPARPPSCRLGGAGRRQAIPRRHRITSSSR